MRTIAIALSLLTAGAASADEGMWTYNNFPSAAVQKKYGFNPTQEWLDKVRLSSARLAQGCSASFVSPDGLVMTNHHCAHECIQQVSSKAKDYVANGFTAQSMKDELKCPAFEINQLTDITDVTARVQKATAGKEGAAYVEAQKAEKSKIEKECNTGEGVRCDVVTLYQGGVYNLYKYKRYQDVRLVFAPELAIAFFGGDPDNFMFPRYDLDVAFVRVYEDGKPAATKNHFPFSKTALKKGDLTFVSGHPGSTSRENTVAETELERDVIAPARLLRLAEIRGVLSQYMTKGKEQARTAGSTFFSVENSYKAWKGMHAALLADGFVASKAKAQQDFVAAIKDPAKKKSAQDAIAKIAASMKTWKELYPAYDNVERGRGFASDLFPIARTLVRGVEEIAKPDEQRLDEFRDSNLPAVKQELLSPAPIHAELDIETLTFGLTKLREQLGADDPLVKKVLGKKSPRTLATETVKGSKLADVKVRQKLWDGGKKAVDESKDPMIALARLVDGDARAIRKKYEDEIESVVEKQHETLAKLKFEALGTSVYPDATFTLRLSYGAVDGWKSRGVEVAPFTTLAGAYERHTGEDPFALPKSWLDKKAQLDLTTPFNFVTTNDIIGGNSGSPVINKDAEVVGLIFDGNIESLGGDYGFDAAVNRAVAVDTRAILEALNKVYGAKALAEELGGKRPNG